MELHMGLTREQAEQIGRQRQRLARKVEKMMRLRPKEVDVDEALERYYTKEKDPYYRKLAGQAIGRSLTEGEEVHIFTHIPGIEDAEVAVPIGNSYSHKKLEFFYDANDYLNQLPNGAFVIQKRPIKPIVDVFR